MIQTGSSTVAACLTEGVTYRRFRQLCASRPTYQKHYQKAEQLRFDVRRERMEALVIEHAEQSWQSAIAWLERNIPSKWALKLVPRVDHEQEQVLDRVTPEQLLEDIRLAREVAGERPQLTDNSAGLPNGDTPAPES